MSQDVPPDLAPIPTADLARAVAEHAARYSGMVAELRRRNVDEVVAHLRPLMGPDGSAIPDVRGPAKRLEELKLRALMGACVCIPMRVHFTSESPESANCAWAVKIQVLGHQIEFEEDVSNEDLHDFPNHYAGIIGAFRYEDPEQLAPAAALNNIQSSGEAQIALDRAFTAITDFVGHAMDFAACAKREGYIDLQPIQNELKVRAIPVEMAP